MKVAYTLSIYIFAVLMNFVSLFNDKARLWVRGRKNWLHSLRMNIKPGKKTFWFHCASLGEFEQGRPFIEMIKEKAPEIQIVLTFFSPSGYEIMKDYNKADYVCYLPADTPGNASRFISAVNPDTVIFVKYEFWANYISELHKRKIPLYLVSGIFRPDQHFFKWYGGFFRKILRNFTYLFVQDDGSLKLLKGIGIKDVMIAGDTRFDRVSKIVSNARELPLIDKFRGAEKLFIAGSSWKEDEEMISEYINDDPGKMKWIFAPHVTDKSNIDRLEKLFHTEVVRYSQFSEDSHKARVLIIDNIGILSSAYRYSYMAAVGGGFGDGIHSILEPASWGNPVMFGPDYDGFKEAFDLIDLGGAFRFTNAEEFKTVADNWLNDSRMHKKASDTVREYIEKNTGATEKIFDILVHKRY